MCGENTFASTFRADVMPACMICVGKCVFSLSFSFVFASFSIDNGTHSVEHTDDSFQCIQYFWGIFYSGDEGVCVFGNSESCMKYETKQ